MQFISFHPFRTLALSGGIAISLIAMPAIGGEPGQQAKDACAAAASGPSASSTVSAGGNGSRSSAAVTRNGSASVTNEECRLIRCGPSSSVTAGPGGVSGSTSLPDGSSVTVHSRNGVSGSSSATSSSSNSHAGSSAAAGAAQGGDCAVTVTPDTKEPTLQQQK